MVSNDKVCFVSVFNHRYDRNIEKLEKIYKERFPNLFYLMPFYEGNRRDVISFYTSSHCFQGSFSQSFERIFDEKYSHYIFVADDLILNPKLKAENIIDELKLTEKSGYIKNIQSLSNTGFTWPHLLPALKLLKSRKVEQTIHWKKELPDTKDAIHLFKKHGIELEKLKWQSLIESLSPGTLIELFNLDWKFLAKGLIDTTKAITYLISNYQDLSMPYPLAMGYSDFVVVPSNCLYSFCRFCGIFSAMELFAEVAIPTALLLTCEEIVTEKNTAWKGIEVWGNDRKKTFLEKSNNLSLSDLFDLIGENELYLHPVKLSQFKY